MEFFGDEVEKTGVEVKGGDTREEKKGYKSTENDKKRMGGALEQVGFWNKKNEKKFVLAKIFVFLWRRFYGFVIAGWRLRQPSPFLYRSSKPAAVLICTSLMF